MWKKLNESLFGVDSYDALAYSFFLSGLINAPFSSDKVLHNYYKSKGEALVRLGLFMITS
jgi:hypothetical protein